METTKVNTEEHILHAKIETLIAMGAATAANCIPCFEHLYEKAVNSGVSKAEIQWAAEIAAQVKNGAHIALKNSMNEIIGIKEFHDLPCHKSEDKSCCC